MSRENLHSWLQYAVIHSGESLSIIPVPEIKLRYYPPLDPKNLRKDYKLNGKRKVSFKRVDVGFYESYKTLVGFAEIVTMDEAHGAADPSSLFKPSLTPHISLRYLAKNSNPKPSFCLLIVAFPRNAKKIPWKTTESKHEQLKKTHNYYEVFIDDWKGLVDKLNESFSTKMIIIVNSLEINTYP